MESRFVTLKQIDIPLILNGVKRQFISTKGLRYSRIQKQDTLDNCPFGENGTILWVREGFGFVKETRYPLYYKASCFDQELFDSIKWVSPVNMVQEDSRFKLKVVNRRLINLQDLTESDFKSQGIQFDADSGYFFYGNAIMGQSYEDVMRKYCDSAFPLWPQISWKRNPLIWVIDFQFTNGFASVGRNYNPLYSEQP